MRLFGWMRKRPAQPGRVDPLPPLPPPPPPEFCRFCGRRNNSDEAFWCSTRNPGCSDGR